MCVGVPYKKNGVQKRCGLNDDVTEVRAVEVLFLRILEICPGRLGSGYLSLISG